VLTSAIAQEPGLVLIPTLSTGRTSCVKVHVYSRDPRGTLSRAADLGKHLCSEHDAGKGRLVWFLPSGGDPDPIAACRRVQMRAFGPGHHAADPAPGPVPLDEVTGPVRATFSGFAQKLAAEGFAFLDARIRDNGQIGPVLTCQRDGMALTDATEVLFITEAPYPRAEIRRALATWAYSTRLRGQTEPPEDIAAVVKWLAGNTITVAALASTETGGMHARAILDRISSKQDGTLAAANTANRKRTVLNNLMTYAERERKLLSGNPLKSVTWSRPRKLKTVDPRCVINSDQARRFLDAVGNLGPRGRRLKTFFGCMYYAAMRPEEVADLRAANIAALPAEDGLWGEWLLTNAQPRSGSNWTDDGSVRQRQELKHRAKEATSARL
jgi:hypothetical protein